MISPGFGETRWSVVMCAGGARTPASSKALAELCAIYRAPLVAFASRLRCLEGHRDRIEDVVQGFFVHLLERDVVGAADPARGRFRVFLRTALRHYALKLVMSEAAVKRGGGVDFSGEVDALATNEELAPDRLCDQLWAQTVLDRALTRLAAEENARGRGALFEALRDHLVDDDEGRLRDLARRVGRTDVDVRVTKWKLKKRLAKVLRDEIADTLGPADPPPSASGPAVDAELRDLYASWIAHV